MWKNDKYLMQWRAGRVHYIERFRFVLKNVRRENKQIGDVPIMPA